MKPPASHRQHSYHLHPRPLLSAIVVMPLCQSCENFRIHSFADDPDGLRGYGVQTVIGEAFAGCEFCNLLLNWLGQELAFTDDTWVHLRLENLKENVRGYGLDASRLRTFVTSRFIETVPSRAELELGFDWSKRYGSLWTREHANHDCGLAYPEFSICLL